MSHLYFLFTENGFANPEGRINEKITGKIGITNDPKSRFDQLQTGAHETFMAHTWKLNDPQTMEKFLHNIYRVHRLEGEWFALPYNDYHSVVELLCSVSLYCKCNACSGFYSIQRVAQKQIDKLGSGGYRRWGA